MDTVNGKHHWDGQDAKWARKNLEPLVFFSYNKNKFVRCWRGRLAEVIE